MARPPSIVRFEQLYLASLAVWLIATGAFWSLNRRLLEANPQYAANPQVHNFAVSMMIGTAVIVFAASLLFWWLVARRGSPVGKWLVIVTEALGALFALFAVYSLATGAVPSVANTLLNLLSTVLAIAAAALLVRPDANAWFADGRGEPVEPYA